GHTLLRLDASDADDKGSWLSWAVNFGAVVDDEASMLYIYRGLAGSYPGYFSTVPCHTKIQEYAHLENRDMWEYPLNLNHEERQWLIEHLWELQDVRFDYYFLDENCSFRLLELMEVARPGSELLTHFRFTELPVDTVRAMIKADLVAGENYRPSKAVELKAIGAEMTVSQRRIAQRLAKDPDYDQAPFSELSMSEQRRVLKAAYELLRFQQRNKERDATAARHSMELLRRLVAHPNERASLSELSMSEQRRVLKAAYEQLRFQQRNKERDATAARHSMELLRCLSAYPKESDAKPTPPEPPELGHGTKMVAITGGAIEG